MGYLISNVYGKKIVEIYYNFPRDFFVLFLGSENKKSKGKMKNPNKNVTFWVYFLFRLFRWNA